MGRFGFPFFCIFLVAAAIIWPFVTAGISAEREALIAFRASVGGRTMHWDTNSQSPCFWAGVVCNASGNYSTVTELHFPGMGLSGKIPPNTISNLTNLRTLSLRYNSFSGILPPKLFSSLTLLRSLYLQHNSFSGEIPDSLFSLTSLVRLSLADNDFSGPISPSFSKLPRLKTLYLQDNRLIGRIPDLNLSGLHLFNVSNNNLTGKIPQWLSGKPRSSFLGNSLCGKPLDSCEKSRKKLSSLVIAGIIAGSLLGLLLLLLLLLCLCRALARRRKRSKEEDGVANAKEVEITQEKVESGDQRSESSSSIAAAMGAKGKGKRGNKVVIDGKKSLVFFGKTGWNFDLEDLLRAPAEVLGKGKFGTAYKAVMESGLTVAVKRLRDINLSEEEFREKMDEVGKMDDQNLAPLRAYYYNEEEKLLVYDYMPTGSLSALLHGDKGAGKTPVNWETRVAIAFDAARGISYIHSLSPTLSHGNIKSSNILLTQSYSARVSDFCLTQLAGPNATPNRASGYRAPEVTDPRKVSQKADVYSFGVLLLELLTGKAPTQSPTSEEGVDLPRWVQSMAREEWTAKVLDHELVRHHIVEEDMVQLLQLAMDCVAQHPDERPSMMQVCGRIEEICHFNALDRSGDHLVGDIVDAEEEQRTRFD